MGYEKHPSGKLQGSAGNLPFILSFDLVQYGQMMGVCI